jgi:hypothetical protein
MNNIKIAKKKPIEIEVIQITFKDSIFYCIYFAFYTFNNPIAFMTTHNTLYSFDTIVVVNLKVSVPFE